MRLLEIDETVSIVLDTAFEGQYQVSCDIFTANVKMQFSDDEGATWVDGSFNGTPIQLTTAGDILDQYFVRGRYYKFITASKGSRVTMFKYDESG